jgi:hypothetical protein
VLSVVEPEADALLKLNDYRTGFVHFKPGGWSVEASSIPPLLRAAAKVTRDLMLNIGLVRIDLNDEEIEQIETMTRFVARWQFAQKQ